MSKTRSKFEDGTEGDSGDSGDAGDPGVPGEEGACGLAVRRHHDRCFHAVEEVVPGGYIVQGIFIDEDDVAQVRRDGEGGACRRVL